MSTSSLCGFHPSSPQTSETALTFRTHSLLQSKAISFHFWETSESFLKRVLGFSKQPSHLGVEWERSQLFVPEYRCICFFLLFFFFLIYESHLFVLQFESLSADRNGNPLQYSFLENPMDRGAWWATVHVVIVRHTQDLRLISITVLGKHLTLVSSFLPKFLPASVSHVACLIPAGGLVPQPTTSVYCRNLPSPFLRSWAGLLLRQVGHETSLLHTNWLNSY